MLGKLSELSHQTKVQVATLFEPHHLGGTKALSKKNGAMLNPVYHGMLSCRYVIIVTLFDAYASTARKENNNAHSWN